MTYELFAPQLVRNGAPTCSLCGTTMNGKNCTCATERMWLYRASQGALDVSVCHIRDLTDDCSGGNNLRQMEAVSAHYRITNGRVYQPISVDQVFDWIDTGRYGSHLDINYEPVSGGPHDAFSGRFKANHDIFLSGPGASLATIRVGDPGSNAFHDWPKSLLKEAAGLLALSDTETLNDEAGRGKCYAYLTPADPATPTTLWHVVIRVPLGEDALQLYAMPNGAKDGRVRAASYTVRKRDVSGIHWYQIIDPGGKNNSKWFKPNRYTKFSTI